MILLNSSWLAKISNTRSTWESSNTIFNWVLSEHKNSLSPAERTLVRTDSKPIKPKLIHKRYVTQVEQDSIGSTSQNIRNLLMQLININIV